MMFQRCNRYLLAVESLCVGDPLPSGNCSFVGAVPVAGRTLLLSSSDAVEGIVSVGSLLIGAVDVRVLAALLGPWQLIVAPITSKANSNFI
jgi:hypothetical protein